MDKLEGKLTINESGQWEIWDDRTLNYIPLTSGSLCEVKIGGHWIATRIEYSDGVYYAVAPGIKLYRGMPARA